MSTKYCIEWENILADNGGPFRRAINTTGNISKKTIAAGQNFAAESGASGFIQGAVAGVQDVGQKIFDGISDGAENMVSSLRGKNLPKGIEAEKGPQASFSESAENKDWRVSLGMPFSFGKSPLLMPLKSTGYKMVFPYTPTVIISHSANYGQIAPIHNNYPFFAYQNSQVDSLVLTGQFYCQNSLEAQYWTACLHYLRSVTKMYYGTDESSGNPPPIVKLNGYGDYVFNNVPVVVTNFTVDMPAEVDYISTQLLGPSGAVPVGDFDNSPTAIPGDDTGWAPAESQFTVTVQPIYSRDAVSKFSLQNFVNGDMVKGTIDNGGGFI